MTKRTLGDDIEDHFYGTQGVYTGSPINEVGLEQHRQRKRDRTTGFYPPSAGAEPKSAEENLAALIGLGAAIFIFYVGLTSFALAWYWSLGAAAAGGIGSARLLLGPFYGLLVVIKWAIIGSALLFVGWLFFGP